MQKGGVRPFTYDFVARILDNPFYCGKVCYNRRTNKKDHNGKNIKCPVENVITVQGKHEAIISEEMWNKIQGKRLALADKYKKSADQVYTHILSGIIRCPDCGRPLAGYASSKKNPNGEGYYKPSAYYRCRYRNKENGCTCNSKTLLNQEIVDSLVFEIICNLQSYQEFNDALENALGANSSAESLGEKLRSLRKELHDTESLKNRIGDQLDALNPMSPSYDKSYAKLSEKQDEVYDRIDELESEIKTVRQTLDSLQKKTETYENITAYISNLRPLISAMTDEEKKEFCNKLIESIEVFSDDRADGKVIKSISFKFPFAFDGRDIKETTKSGNTISFTLDCTDIEISLPERGKIRVDTKNGRRKVVANKPTYEAINKYVIERYGTKVSTLCIAQTKRKYGLDMGIAYNKPEQTKNKVPKCTPEKEKMILEALKHFNFVEESTKYREDE